MALRISVIVCAHNAARWPAVERALRQNVDVALTPFRNGTWAA